MYSAAQKLCTVTAGRSMPNLTIRIDDEELIRRAKVIAASRKSSLSAMVRAFLERLVRREDEYESARRRAVSQMRRGRRMGGRPLSRDEAHDER